MWGGRGQLTLVETAGKSADQYKPLASLEKVFNDDVWPHVVLANGRLYCKDRDGNLACFALGGHQPVDR